MEDNGIIAEIRQTLFSMKDSEYKELQAKILPTLESDAIIGVRTPQLRKYAKQLSKDSTITRFLDDLPHKYFPTFAINMEEKGYGRWNIEKHLTAD